MVLRVGEEALRSALGSGFLIIYGLILAGVILYMPRGLVGVWTSVTARRREISAAEARGGGRL